MKSASSWPTLLLELTSTSTTRKLHKHSWIILSTSTMVRFITKFERVFRHDSRDNLNHGTISKAYDFVSFVASKEIKNSSQNSNVFWKTFHSTDYSVVFEELNYTFLSKKNRKLTLSMLQGQWVIANWLLPTKTRSIWVVRKNQTSKEFYRRDDSIPHLDNAKLYYFRTIGFRL